MLDEGEGEGEDEGEDEKGKVKVKVKVEVGQARRWHTRFWQSKGPTSSSSLSYVENMNTMILFSATLFLCSKMCPCPRDWKDSFSAGEVWMTLNYQLIGS